MPDDGGRAWSSGHDLKTLARSLNAAHDHFVDSGRVGQVVRPLVAKSWARSMVRGLDPEAARAPVELQDHELRAWRESHPLAPAMPVVRKLLVEHAAEAGMLVAVSDHLGRLLWVEGAPRVREQARDINFVEGALWSEAHAGTNAPGTALVLDQPVQIFGAEHLSRTVTPWSCTAVPVHDPDSGVLLGCLDVTGGDEVAAPNALWLVRAAATAVEGELRWQRLTASDRADRAGGAGRAPQMRDWTLEVLGRPRALLRRPGEEQALGLRHSELLTLLTHHPAGCTGEQLSMALYERDSATVSLRAELSRLRPLLDPVRLLSRPYRLPERLSDDVAVLRDLLARGEVLRAAELYRGPVLPASSAPGILALRREVHEEVRSALLDAGDAEALLRFASAEHGLLDWEAWSRALEALPAESGRRSQVSRHVDFLDRELGSAR